MRNDAPRIAKALPMAPYKVAVTWDNGVSATIDLVNHLKRLAVFAPLLRDKSLLEVDKEFTYHLASPNQDDSPDLEVPTDLLWRLYVEQSGQVISPQDFAGSMGRHRLF